MGMFNIMLDTNTERKSELGNRQKKLEWSKKKKKEGKHRKGTRCIEYT